MAATTAADVAAGPAHYRATCTFTQTPAFHGGTILASEIHLGEKELVMRRARQSTEAHAGRCSPRIIVVVVERPQPAERLNALLADAQEYDVIFVEPIAHAYSRIKQVTPDVIVLLNEVSEVAACQLLSMLAMDAGFRGTLVTTCAPKRLGGPRRFVEPTAVALC